MSRHQALRALLVALGAAFGAGCLASGPTGAFNHRFPDNEREPTAKIAQNQPAPAAPSKPDNALGTPVAVGTTLGDERHVVAFDVAEGKELWSRPLEALTRPEIHGDVVMTSVHGEVICLDLRSGEELWREENDNLAYVGADRQGNVLVYVVSVGASGGARRIGIATAVDPRSGRELWQHEIRGVLARPAIRGKHVFIPWDRQNIAILNLASGLEKARLRTTDDVIDWAFATEAGLYYGGRGIYRFTEESYTGTKEGSAYRPPPLAETPGEPLVHDNGFMPTPGMRSARGRIRTYFAPAPPKDNEAVAILGDRFYYVYYRYVFAFDEEETLQWVRLLDEDVINAQPLEQGLLAFGEKGTVRILDRTTGNDRWTGALGGELASLGIDVEGFAPGGEAGEPRDLRTTLNEVALDPDNRLVGGRGFAVQHLARMEEPEITRDLLDLYSQRSMPGALRDTIGEALRERSSGGEYLVKALDQHYDYLEGTRTPPLEVIVPSLLQMELKEALPGLIAQMEHPATPRDVLPLVIGAVVELGGEQALPSLRSFLVLYHADSTFEEKPEALAAAAAGLFEHGGPEGRALLRELMGDGTTQTKLAEHIDGLFVAEQQQAEAHARAEAEAAARAAAEAARREAEARPEKLDQEQINQTFAAHADTIRRCVMQELERNPRLGQVRIVFIVENDGSAHEFQLAPNTPEFVQCLGPRLERLEFPKFKQRRQRATFTVAIRDSSGAPTEEPEENKPWWARYAALADQAPLGPPWWKQRAPQAVARRPNHAASTASVEDLPWWMRPEKPKEPARPATPPEEPPPQEPPAASAEPQPSETQEPAEPEDPEPWWLPTDE